MRLTVIALDRPGLIADSAAVLAGHGLSISQASAGTWGGLALHAFTLRPDRPIDDDAWSSLGADLQSMTEPHGETSLVFMPLGRTTVEVDGDATGHSLVRVSAKDQVGLLWATCRWFADRGISIESVHASTQDGIAFGTFVVDGDLDADALALHLSRPGPRRKVTAA